MQIISIKNIEDIKKYFEIDPDTINNIESPILHIFLHHNEDGYILSAAGYELWDSFWETYEPQPENEDNLRGVLEFLIDEEISAKYIKFGLKNRDLRLYTNDNKQAAQAYIKY